MLSIALPYVAVFNRATRVEKLYDCAPSKEEWTFVLHNSWNIAQLRKFDV